MIKSITIALFFLTLNSLNAQPAESKKDFRLLLLSTEPVWDFSYDLKEKPVHLMISGTQLSSSYISPPAGMLNIYKLIKPPVSLDPTAPPQKPIKQPIAQITLIPGASHNLVLLIPNPPGSPLPYTGYCLDDSQKSQPINTLKVLSFSKRKIAIKFDASAAEINPGASQQLSYSIKNSFVELRLAVANDGGTWLPLMNTVYNVTKNSRVFALAFDDPATAGSQQLVQLRFIPDPSPPTDEQQTSAAPKG